MKEINTKPNVTYWESGMMDKFIRGMYFQIKNEAEVMCPENMDDNIYALRIHQFLLEAFRYIITLGEMDIYCNLVGLDKPHYPTLHQQFSIWKCFMKSCGLTDMGEYLEKRASEVMKEEARLKEEEEKEANP